MSSTRAAIASVASIILLLSSVFVSTLLPIKDVSAQTSPLLKTSVSNVPDKKFYGAQIVQIIIDDSEVRDLGKPRPVVKMDGVDLMPVQGSDGKWYIYVADSASLLALNAIVNVGTPGSGTTAGFIHTALIPRNEIPAASTGIETTGNTPRKSQWPFIQLFSFAADQESTIQYLKGGTVVATEKIKFSRPAISLALESADVARGADVVAQITDYMMNIDPTAKDVFYYRYGTTSVNVFYEDASIPAVKQNITSIFSTTLKFDPTQILTSSDLGATVLATTQVGGSNEVKVAESDISSSIFENVDQVTKRSNIIASTSAQLFSSFTFSYYDKTATAVVRSYTSKITLAKSDFFPNEKVTVDVVDKDLSKSIRVTENLDPRDGGALAAKVGNPVTLAYTTSTPDVITPISQAPASNTVTVKDSSGSTVNTSSLFVKRPTDILYFTPTSAAKTIEIQYPAGTAAKLNGFTHVNVDLNGLNLSSFSSAVITIEGTALPAMTSSSRSEVKSLSGISFTDPVNVSISITGSTADPIVAAQNSKLILDFLNLSATKDDAFYRATIKEDSVHGDFRAIVGFKIKSPTSISTVPLSELKFIDEPVMWISTKHTGIDAIRVLYSDLDDGGAERAVVNVINVKTSTGSIALDKTSYKPGENMRITLTDRDLDNNPATIQTYPASSSLVQIEWLPTGSTSTVLSPPDSTIQYTFVETAAGSGVFEAVFKLPDNLSLTGKLKVNYVDLFDDDGIQRTLSKELTLSTTAAKVTLDRDTYPPSAKVYIEVTDSDLNTNPAGINVVTSPSVLSIRARTGLAEMPVTGDLVETGVDTGIFQTGITLPAPAKESFDVIYKDNSASGVINLSASAVITNTLATLSTDKTTYSPGDKVTITLNEPDSNLDSRAVENIALTAIKFNGETSTTLANSQLLASSTTLRETGPNTGIFTVTIQLASDENLVKSGRSFELAYTDTTLPDGGSETVSVRMAVVASGVEVSLDKDSYSWTSRVYITVKDPSKNSDPNNINTLKVNVRSSQFSIADYTLEEDSINSGIFKGYVTLTGDGTKGSSGAQNAGAGPADGKIPAKHGDAISVQYKASQNDYRSASASINWRLATLTFDKSKYDKGSQVTITVEDLDANLNPDGIDTVTVKVSSLTDSVGISLKLTETGKDTGIFTKAVKMSDSFSSNSITVSSTGEDVISASYDDDTLPDKQPLVKKLLAAAVVGAGAIEELPVGEKAEIKDVAIGGNTAGTTSLGSLAAGSPVVISSAVKNNSVKQELDYSYIVQIINEMGETEFISIQSAKLGPAETRPVSFSWIVGDRPLYKIDLFMVSSLDKPESLSSKQTATIFSIKNIQSNTIDLDKVVEEDRPALALLKVYSERPDLQSSFPEVVSKNDLSKLYEWAAVAGVTTDNANSILRPHLSIYSNLILNSTNASASSKDMAKLLIENRNAIFAILDIYNSRQDLQKSFPEVKSSNDYGRLFKWAITDGVADTTTKPTLEPFTSVYQEQLFSLAEKGLVGMNLLSSTNTWIPANDAQVSSKDGKLALTVNTSKQEQLYHRAILKTKITVEKPIISFDYNSQSISGAATFLFEIRDNADSKVLFSSSLSNTGGKTEKKVFDIPDNLAGQEVILRVYIITTGAGNHLLTIERATVV